MNNILAKIKARQRAAIEKSNQTPAGKEETSSKSLNFEWKYETSIPQITCSFFTRIFQKSICNKEDAWIKTDFTLIERIYSIRLNTQFPKTDWLFDLNKVLNEISPDIAVKNFKHNFNSGMMYILKSDINYITKIILLKALFGDTVINANTLNCFARKRQLTTVPVLSDIDKEKVKTGNDKLQYMGTNPVMVFTEKDNNICVEIVVSTPPSQFKDEVIYPDSKDLSERVMSRIGIILKVIHEKKIFEEVFKLIKVIEEEEFKEGKYIYVYELQLHIMQYAIVNKSFFIFVGYTNKIDRKSLARILKRLVETGYIKIFKLSIYDDKLTKTQTFVCHPSVSHTDSLIQSAYQQLKWKYFVGAHKKTAKTNVPTIQKNLEEKIQQTASPFRQSDVMNSVLELKELNKLKRKEISYKPSRQAGRTYGLKPKFIRMRIIHEFLYYLIYSYDRDTKFINDREVEKLFESYHINVTKEDLMQIPSVYCNEISWKMFIPPLPHHRGWMAGWALMCDVILRLPISVLCKIHNIGFDVPELLEVLNHPIKRLVVELHKRS